MFVDKGIVEETFLDSNEFSMLIMKMASNMEISHMDALLKYCEDNNIEPEDIVKNINRALKDEIEKEASDLNLLTYKMKKGVFNT